MKILRAVQWTAVAAVISLAAFIGKLAYGYWLHKAESEAANSKIFRMDCAGRTFPNCDFTEIPVRVHMFSEVVLPTILCMIPVVAVAVFCIVVIFTSPVLSEGQGDGSEAA